MTTYINCSNCGKYTPHESRIYEDFSTELECLVCHRKLISNL